MATDMAGIAQYIQKALKSVEQLQLLEMLLEGRPHEMKYLEPFIKNDAQNGAAAKAVEGLNLTAKQKEILLTLVRSLIDPDLSDDGPLKLGMFSTMSNCQSTCFSYHSVLADLYYRKDPREILHLSWTVASVASFVTGPGSGR